MRTTSLLAMLASAVALQAGCTHAEPATTAEIRGDFEGHVGHTLRITGEVVPEKGPISYVSIGGAYITVDDGSGPLNVWFGRGGGCAPQKGSSVVVDGEVTKPPQTDFYVFAARKIDVRSAPPLEKDEVRLCMLSREEQETYWREGQEGLERRWRAQHDPVRTVVQR